MSPTLSQDQIDKFHRDGYLVIRDFFSSETAAQLLLARAHTLLNDFSLDGHPGTKFSTGTSQEHVGDQYFLESGDKIRYFFEEDAFDGKGDFREGVTKASSINKIGHGLHELDPVYNEFTLKNDNLKQLARDLAYHKDPLVLQSMIICKQPRIGGLVPIHNDSSFLYTSPPSAIGFWFALEKCEKQNGCLWFLPGSHKRARIRKRFVRRADGGGTEFQPVPGEEGEEERWNEKEFVPEECDVGTLVLIHGSVMHKSEHNRSNKSRFIYTFHMIESEANGAGYDEKNWLQPSKELPFSRLFA